MGFNVESRMRVYDLNLTVKKLDLLNIAIVKNTNDKNYSQ